MTQKKARQLLYGIVLVIGIEACAFAISRLIDYYVHTDTLIPIVFVLAVFLIARFTPGYAYGIAASLLSVLAVNYAFTFPYFAFDFSLPENLLTAVTMITVTVITSTLTSQIKHQEQLRAEADKEKMRANLLRSISHDLRTPLTSIYGASSAILDNYASLPREQQLKLLGDIREDSEWLIHVVENLLSITRINGSTGVRLYKTPTVLEELAEGVLARFRKRYPQQQVNVSIPEEFIRIPMDAMLIEQVMFNLLENAVLHATGLTKIDCSVSVNDAWAVFEVADDGCGIAPERLPELFCGTGEMTGDSTGQKRGMGIGLSVCASIVNAHGGRIQAENRKGGGARFRFTLPMEEETNE